VVLNVFQPTNVAVPDAPVNAYPNNPCAAADVEYTNAAPVPRLTLVNASPDPPPEFDVVTVVPAVPPSALGAPGTANGVTPADADDAAPVPIAFVAVTVNVYAVPFDNPVTVAVVAHVVDAVKPPGEDVTVYPVIAVPPLLAGAVHDTVATPLPGVADTAVGAPGTVATANACPAGTTITAARTANIAATATTRNVLKLRVPDTLTLAPRFHQPTRAGTRDIGQTALPV
jgi:hypothetical protein